MKNNSYICHAPYIRNSVAYDHDFWYTCVNWGYFQVLFSFFKNFNFLGFQGSKRAKTVQNDKKFYPSCFISHQQFIIWLSFMVHLCKMIISPGVFFFIFSKIWFFGLLVGVKGQKMVQNDKKFCHARYLRNHTYVIYVTPV